MENGATNKPIRPATAKPPGVAASPYASADSDNNPDSWTIIQANAEDVRLLIASVLAAGDAVMFSCSRKGVAYAVTIYHDSIPVKKWAAELEVFEEIVDFFTKIALAQIPQEIAKRFTT